jgi:hypothetical protein
LILVIFLGKNQTESKIITPSLAFGVEKLH